MINACLRGVPEGELGTDICVQESNSRMIWSYAIGEPTMALTT